MPERRAQVTLPLPPIECSPNHNKRATRAKEKATKDQRKDAKLATLAVMRSEQIGRMGAVEILFTFYNGGTRAVTTGKSGRRSARFIDRRYRPSDPDNAVASCKSVIDGMVDAGLFASDRAGTVRKVGAVIVRADQAKGRAQLAVTVTEVAP